MARGDFKLYAPSEDQISIKCLVAAGTAVSINAGEPTIRSAGTGTTNGLVKIAADGDPTGADGHMFTGIAKSDSTDTVAAAGVVEVWLPFPGTIYAGKALSATAATTQAKIDALKLARVIFDLTSTNWTVDTAATDAVTGGVLITGGDYRKNMVTFIMMPTVTVFGHDLH
jgi:hypothetical protein